jgi:hypothetical protein
MTRASRFRWLAGALGAAAWMALGAGCYAETGVEPAYVEVSSAPANVDVAPQYS